MLTRILLRCTRHDTYGSWAVPHWWPTHTWLSYDFIAASKGSKAVFTICWIRAFSMFNIRCFFALASASAALALLTSSWSPKKDSRQAARQVHQIQRTFKSACSDDSTSCVLSSTMCNIICELCLVCDIACCHGDITWRPQIYLEIWMARDIPIQASCKHEKQWFKESLVQDMTCNGTFDACPERCTLHCMGKQ